MERRKPIPLVAAFERLKAVRYLEPETICAAAVILITVVAALLRTGF